MTPHSLVLSEGLLLTVPASSQGAFLTAEVDMEGGKGLWLQLSSHLDECVIRCEICPYGGSVVLETKTGLKPNPCQELFVQLGPQTQLGPSLTTHSCSC